MSHPPATGRDAMIIGFLGIIWGGTFMIVAIALEGYGPLTVACARTAFGALSMHLLRAALRRPWPRFDGRMIAFLVLIGLTNTAIPFALMSWAQLYVSSSFVGITTALLPLVILPMAAIFADELFGLRRVVGVLCGFIGALILLGPGALELQLSGPVAFAEAACLFGIFSLSVASVATRLAPPIDAVSMSALVLTVGMIALAPFMFIAEGVPQYGGLRPTVAILGLGLIPTALAALLRIMVIRSSGPVFMTLVNYQVPIWSMIFGAVILGETIPVRFYVALVFVLSGLVIIRWRSLLQLVRP